jgi:Domain of unknown function (DUF4136)
MRLMRGCFAVLLFTVSLGCLAKTRIGSSYDPAAPYSSLKAYNWAPHEMQDSITVNFDEEFVQTHLTAAVNEQLSAKGLQIRTANPDFLILWTAFAGTALGVNRGVATPDRALGGFQSDVSTGPAPRADVMDVNMGTLILTFVDAKTQKVIWRGFAQDAVNFEWSDNKKISKINQVVRKMLELFPPKPGGTGEAGSLVDN